METDEELFTTSELELDNDNEEKNIINKHPEQKKKRLLTSDNETDVDQIIFLLQCIKTNQQKNTCAKFHI